MPVALDRVVRFPAGEEFQFGWALKPELFEAASSWSDRLPTWLQELEGAAVIADSISAERCIVKLCSGKVCATAELTSDQDGTYTIALEAKRGGEGDQNRTWNWIRPKLTAMLGGKRDAYFAVAKSSGAVPVLRLRYSGSSVEVFVLSAAFADRLPAMIRALAPGELKIGELAPRGVTKRSVTGASPCGCH